VTLSGFAGREYLPLPASKQLLQLFTFMDNGVRPETQETPALLLIDRCLLLRYRGANALICKINYF
jgi:hypothetical protein